MIRPTLAILLLTLAGCRDDPGPPIKPPPPPVTPPSAIARQLLEAHNRERAVKRLPALRASAQLQKAADAHAAYMAKVNQLAHFGIGDGDPWGRIRATGYSYSAASENAAARQRDVDEVMRSWMASPGHRANVLGRYADFGGGMAKSRDGTAYWCTVFASPGTPGPVPLVPSSVPPPVETGDGLLIPPANHD